MPLIPTTVKQSETAQCTDIYYYYRGMYLLLKIHNSYNQCKHEKFCDKVITQAKQMDAYISIIIK